MSESGLRAALAKMQTAEASQAAMTVFSHYYRALESGVTGIISEDSIEPLASLPQLTDVEISEIVATQALQKTVIIKLNGGLGTSMGLDRAKTLLEVRSGKTFLDLLVAQVLWAREKYAAKLPLIFMNSPRTQGDTLEYLAKYDQLAVADLPLDFLQNFEPKLLAADLTPVEWPQDSSLEWCPPGHGDLYTALWGTGLLQRLLAAGYQYAAVANGDNLGAAPDAKLAGWFAQTNAPFAMEVCERTANDRKGGHLAMRKEDGQLVLREIAQTPQADLAAFANIERHRYFNTNNLWLNLEKLAEVLAAHDGALGLPLICNEKNVDPSDLNSPKVLQLESAMGAAIEVFPDAQAIAVTRDRFLPVKTTNELLLLRSDLFTLGADSRLIAQVSELPEITLDARYYQLVNDFSQRFAVLPSLRQAQTFVVNGDWWFTRPIAISGCVELPDLSGFDAAAAHAMREDTWRQLGVWETRTPSARTQLNADEIRLLADKPPHHIL